MDTATATAEIKDVRIIGARQRVAAFVELTKPRIAFLLVLTSAAGFYLGSGENFDYVKFVNSVIGISLLAFGVATLNQYIEREVDVLMDRTAARPLPTSRVTPLEALTFGIIQCAVAELYLFFLVNALTAALGVAVIVGYVLLYTPLKRKSSISTAVGAFPGALPPLMGWTAAADHITVSAWSLFAMQFLWQFPHFLAIAWMYREQYAKAGILMLPVVEPEGRLTAQQIVVFTVMLVPVSLAPYFFGLSGVIYVVGAVLLGLWFLGASVKAARSKSDRDAKKLLMVSVIYLPILFLLMVADKL